MALATVYRPIELEEMVGNESTIKSLQAVLSKPRADIPHAFLFTGPSGCGKTTLGRIVKEMLGARGNDYVEVDSADFRGIDTIRKIRENINYVPIEGDCRVWLLDECHQLSRDAQNALLKALEDTPDHVYFILATTDPEKLLPTIKGRCSTFEVEPISQMEMTNFLREIVSCEKKRIHPDVLQQISYDSMGSCRNALQILDKVIDLAPEDQMEAAKNTAAKANATIDLCRALFKMEKWSKIADILEGLEKEDPEKIRLAVFKYCGQSLKAGRDQYNAFVVMDSFRNPIYNNGFADIVYSCFLAIEGMKATK